MEEFTFSCLENQSFGKVVFATLMMRCYFNLTNLALQVFFYVDMSGLPPFFWEMKTFPQFLINENRDLFTKSNSALFGFQFIGGQTCGFCSNESCKGRKIKSRPNTRFLMEQTSDFVNRSGYLEMNFRFIQNKDFET